MPEALIFKYSDKSGENNEKTRLMLRRIVLFPSGHSPFFYPVSFLLYNNVREKRPSWPQKK